MPEEHWDQTDRRASSRDFVLLGRDHTRKKQDTPCLPKTSHLPHRRRELGRLNTCWIDSSSHGTPHVIYLPQLIDVPVCVSARVQLIDGGLFSWPAGKHFPRQKIIYAGQLRTAAKATSGGVLSKNCVRLFNPSETGKTLSSRKSLTATCGPQETSCVWGRSCGIWFGVMSVPKTSTTDNTSAKRIGNGKENQKSTSNKYNDVCFKTLRRLAIM